MKDDLGALKEEKTTSEGAGNEKWGAKVEMDGRAAPDQPYQPEGATAQPSDELGRGAPPRPPPSIPPIQPDCDNEEEVTTSSSVHVACHRALLETSSREK